MADSAPMTEHEESRSPPLVSSVQTDQLTVAENPIVAVLPPTLIASARMTSWDEPASAALELFMMAIFDADGDGMLNDVERIVAVRSLRDAVWPTSPNATPGDLSEKRKEARSLAATATLSARDRRLHHDVDEARRRDRQEGGEVGQIDGKLRAEIVRRFRTEDDGHLTVSEFARYMVLRNAGSAAADLNGDGQIDDADLRVFLDVTSPID
jgi:hypothetical protein